MPSTRLCKDLSYVHTQKKIDFPCRKIESSGRGKVNNNSNTIEKKNISGCSEQEKFPKNSRKRVTIKSKGLSFCC